MKMNKSVLVAIFFVIAGLGPLSLGAAEEPSGGSGIMTGLKGADSKLARIVEADIIATHAYQVLLAQGCGKGDQECFSASGLSKDDLEALVAHQEALFASDPAALVAWAEGREGAFDPSEDLEPILSSPLDLGAKLPVNVFTDYLLANAKCSRLDARAIASLYQTVLEINRDGDLLQDEYRLLVALGLPVYTGQVGLPGSDEDFLKAGEACAGKTCQAPFDTDAAAWQIGGRKVWNWGEKNLHVRDAAILAKELLAEAGIAALIPKIKALAPQKIACIGHSFTSDTHWSTPSSFVPIVTQIFQAENPGVEFRQWIAGGLSASRAKRNFYQEALDWKPDKVLFVVVIRGDEDIEALREMCSGFAEAGVSTYTFDSLRDPSVDSVRHHMGEKVAKGTGLVIVEVGQVLAAAPDKDTFLCLDNIHMTEPYHRLMAKEWLKFLVGAREAKLPE